ncbi:MAG TPA: hypothetical protein VKY37_07285, partial [Brumimicrobium sp.]|nr:hypothetical protein [Brumimicrobium sp.]
MKTLKLLLLFTVLIGTTAVGQYKPKNKKKQFYGNQRLHQPIYRWVTGDYNRHGIQLSFGPTYTFTKIGAEEFEHRIPSSIPSVDTLVRFSREAKSRIGIFGEIGMVHITKRPRKLVHYYDWGIGFKLYGGRELSETRVFNDRDSLIDIRLGEGKFYNGYLYGRFAAHNVYQINPYLFLDNALGLNLDYALMIGNMAYDGFHVPVDEKFQGDLMGQLHYSIGLGIKPRVDKGFFFVPSIELPVLGIHE